MPFKSNKIVKSSSLICSNIFLDSLFIICSVVPILSSSNSISLRTVLYAADVANIYTMLNKELSRRGYSTLSTNVSSNSKVNTTLKNEIFTNISKMQSTSYNGDACKKSEMQKAITTLKTLYSKILKS